MLYVLTPSESFIKADYCFSINDVQIAVDGNFSLVFGTSASAPVFGSIITLVNDARLAVGKSSVGFINPTVSDRRIQNASMTHNLNCASDILK